MKVGPLQITMSIIRRRLNAAFNNSRGDGVTSKRCRLASRYPLIEIPAGGPEHECQCQKKSQVQRHSFGRITDVVEDIGAERARYFADMLGQRRPHTPPEFSAPDRLALPFQNPGNRLLLNSLNLC